MKLAVETSLEEPVVELCPPLEQQELAAVSQTITEHDLSHDAQHPVEEYDAPVVWEIEARLIAGQSDEIIANKLGLSTAIVTQHIAMHFDYRADLDHDSRLFFSAVMGRLTPGGELTEGDIWRLVAWLYGPVGVDLIIDDYHGRTDPKNTEATVLAGLLRAQAVVRFVSPRCKPYADALRQLRKRFSRRRDASAKKIVAYCNLLLIAAGWNPNGKGRLDSKARCAASDKLTDEQLSDQIQKAWDEIKEVK